MTAPVIRIWYELVYLHKARLVSAYYSSTNLDIWSWIQLRTMKVGGNASYTDFLARHPGSSSFGSDTKDKYGSRAALLYKEELARRAAVDEQAFGKGKVWVEGMATAGDNVATPPKAEADFFDTWDAPATLKAPINPNSSSNLMTFGRSPGTTPLNSRPASPSVPATTTVPGPRTVTSSSLRTAGGSTISTARPKVSALGSVRTTSSSGANSLGARSKLGVKKGGMVNFEAAEKKAREEEDRIKQMGFDALREQEAAAAAAAASAASYNAISGAGSVASSSDRSAGNNSPANGKSHARKLSADTERLGMGMNRLGFGQSTGLSGEQAAKQAAAAAKAALRKANGYQDEAGTIEVRRRCLNNSDMISCSSRSQQHGLRTQNFR